MIYLTKSERRALETENKKWPEYLQKVPREAWPHSILPIEQRPKEVWRSRQFLMQIFDAHDGIERLSICRTTVAAGSWQDGISWDDIQRLKREAGRGDKAAVEIFPPDAAIVNVANMRHLWVVPEPPPFMWSANA